MRTDFRQHDKTDCAAACIASIARHYGREIPLTVIREASGTDCTGTTVKGIIDACGRLGFKARGYRSPDRDLSRLAGVGAPVILHVVNQFNDLHFVVLYGIRRGKAIIMDPTDGRHHRVEIGKIVKGWSGYLCTMVPDPDFCGHSSAKDVDISNSIFHRYTSILALASKDIALSIAGAVAYMVASICTALFLQHIIDVTLPSGSMSALAQTGLLMASIMICTLVIGYGQAIFTLRAGVRIDSSLILEYISHLFSLPVGFFTRRGAGELNSRITDAMKVRSFLTQGVTGLLTSFLLLAVSFALMFSYYWKMALFTLLFIPAYILLYVLADRANRRLNRRVIENAAAFGEECVERISSIRTIKHFGDGNAVCRGLDRRYSSLCTAMYDSGRAGGIFATSTDAVSKTLTVFLLTIGSTFVFRGAMSVGELVSFYSLTAYFSSPLGQLVKINESLTESNVALERIFDILCLEPEGCSEMTLDLPLDKPQTVTMEHVSFAYPGCSTLLEDFSLELRPGSLTAINGESGCGKSSLAALLMRDYDVTSGRIAVGGIDIRQTDLSRWRRYVSIVPQEAGLMNGTILENITGMERGPEIEKVVGLLDSLGLRPFLASLPMGLLTRIGEGGCRLSGGQKQRLALARALYRDPQLLILDEATSSLDAESERIILEKIMALRDEGRTIVMITHKKENAAIADTTVTMMNAHSYGG